MNNYIGRKIETFNITESKEIDLKGVVSIHAELSADTPVFLNAAKLNDTGDTYCDNSYWPYVEGSTLNVAFVNNQGNLKLQLTRLVEC